MIRLSHDQKKALDAIIEWYKKDKAAMQYVTLGGYAGTGKTTLIAHLRLAIRKIDPVLKVGFVSYTGKAARVLQQKLHEHSALLAGDTVGTIHSLIYSPVLDDREEIVGWQTKEKIECSLIIVDEASMVDSVIFNHLKQYRVPIVVVGDHGQLPPIRGTFNLMERPILALKQIHRQTKKNPIIALSIHVR